MRCIGTRTAVAALVAALLVVGAAGAELAILDNGEFLQVDAYGVDGERMRLELRAGGVLELPIRRVVRILDDELPTETPPEALDELEESFVLGFAPGATVPTTPYGQLLFEAARRHSLNPRLLAAVARAESAFDARAHSHKGARGLLQLMPATAARFGVEPDRLWDPEQNIEAGARYLRFLVDHFEGDLELVLAAYNAGEGAVSRYQGVPPYRETREYLVRITRFLGLGDATTAG